MSLKDLKILALITLPVTMSSANDTKRFIFSALIEKNQDEWLDKAISTCGYPRDRRIFNSVKLAKAI